MHNHNSLFRSNKLFIQKPLNFLQTFSHFFIIFHCNSSSIVWILAWSIIYKCLWRTVCNKIKAKLAESWLFSPCSSMAVREIFLIVHNRAAKPFPFTFLSFKLHLFSTFGLGNTRIEHCHHLKVRIRSQPLLKSWYGSYRSKFIECTATCRIDFCWESSEKSWI